MATLGKEDPTLLFLLDPPRPAKPFRDELWGSLVVRPVKPTDGYSSYERKAPRTLVPSIDIEPQRVSNYAEIIKWSRHSGAEATVHSVLSGFLKANETETEFRRATYADFYYMTSPKAQLSKLLKNDEWSADALRFIQDNQGEEILFVTSMLVVGKAHIGRGAAESLDGGAGATLRNPADGGATKLVEGKFGAGQSEQRTVEGQFEKPQILAVGYRPVRITAVVNDKKPNSFKARLLALFGRKPRYRLVGQLYDIDTKTLYQLKLGADMAPGNVAFLEGHDSDDEEEEEGAKGEAAGDAGAEAATHEGEHDQPLPPPTASGETTDAEAEAEAAEEEGGASRLPEIMIFSPNVQASRACEAEAQAPINAHTNGTA